LSTLGINPSGADITVQLRLAGVEQATTYSLPAGLKSAENTAASVAVPLNTWHDFVIVTTGDAADLIVEAEFEVSVAAVGQNTTDLGLGTLGQLKRFLLTAGIVSETTYDEAITAIGKGVAGLIDRHCNRTFKRGVAVTEEFIGGTDNLKVERYPIESVASIGLQSSGETGYTVQAASIANNFLKSGIVKLLSQLGTEDDQIQVTYTGGYWYDPTDDDSGTMPAAATLLEPNVKMIWLNECQHVWQASDRLGIQHIPQGENALLNTRLGILELSPASKAALEPYRRLML
jgi:hypothetical protein